MSEWQPIETAPYNGREILGAYLNGNATDYSIVAWDGTRFLGYCDGSRAIEYQSDFGTEYFAPYLTHWMPLPDPPTT